MVPIECAVRVKATIRVLREQRLQVVGVQRPVPRIRHQWNAAPIFSLQPCRDVCVVVHVADDDLVAVPRVWPIARPPCG